MSPAIASARREELRDTFRRFIDLALETRADAVLRTSPTRVRGESNRRLS